MARVLVEVAVLWLVVNLLIRAVLAAQKGLGLHEAVQALVPFLFIYVPVLLCRLRRVDSYGYRLYIPAFRDRSSWWRALRINGMLLAAGVVPWLVGYHLYQTRLFGFHPHFRLPHDLVSVVAYHVFFVAIPEEFFYRGYLQTRLNEVFPRKYLLFGVPFGHAVWIVSLFFAFGHSLVAVQWWHFAIFFPGLLFAMVREKTGDVITPAFLHASCNIIVHVLDTMYGIR